MRSLATRITRGGDVIVYRIKGVYNSCCWSVLLVHLLILGRSLAPPPSLHSRFLPSRGFKFGFLVDGFFLERCQGEPVSSLRERFLGWWYVGGWESSLSSLILGRFRWCWCWCLFFLVGFYKLGVLGGIHRDFFCLWVVCFVLVLILLVLIVGPIGCCGSELESLLVSCFSENIPCASGGIPRIFFLLWFA